MNAADLYARIEARLPDTIDASAPDLAHHVLAALADRLTPEEAAELGMELPDELGDILATANGDGLLDRDDFLEDIASRLDIDDDDAEAGTIAVLTALREALEPVLQIEQVLESLPPDLAQLMS